MFVNKDHDNDHSVKVKFNDANHDRFYSGTVERVVFGQAEYQWHADPTPQGAPSGNGGGRRRGWGNGHADPDGPASKSTVKAGGADTLYQLPKSSVIVLRGKLTN
jgi:hypothetical protein